MKIYTSRYGNKQIAKTKLIPVGISLYPPRWKLSYKVHSYIRALAPTPKMVKIKDYRLYKKLYIEKLNSVNIEELKATFKKISLCPTSPAGAQSRDLVLLCFNDLTKEGEFCHRRMFAEWWQKKTGQKIEELGC